MINYNAKDLIIQAQMLADLQNSDFISWKENMMFLDNAWADLYQQIINHGDKSFLQSFSFEGGSCTLPDDFYQLYYICYNDGCFRRPINRRSKTSTNEGPFYDIVGNELVIYNKMNSVGKIEVEYFPIRDAITFASDDVKIPEIDGTIIDVCDKKVLFTKSDEWFIKDIINNTEALVTEGGFILSDNGVVNSIKPCFKGDNKVYYSEYENDVLSFKKKNGITIVTIDNPVVVPNFPTNQINAFTKNAVFYVTDNQLKRFDFETGKEDVWAEGLINTKVWGFNDSVYYETKEGIWCDTELIIKATDYDTFWGVMKVDENTGYGILVDNLVIKSAYKNTELDFPNNVYYNYLAYDLATYYKIKQGADPTGVSAIANNALKVFYDTLPRDENEYIRISNVYAR